MPRTEWVSPDPLESISCQLVVSTYRAHNPTHATTTTAKEQFVMASHSKQNEVVETMNDGRTDFAVGSQEVVERSKVKTFYRSVLFQMILFGMCVAMLAT